MSPTATAWPRCCLWPAPPLPWNLLPAKELGCGSTTTCWRRLDEWARAGVFEQLQAVLLDELGEADRLDLERVLVDSASVRSVKGGADRRKSGRPRQAGDQAAPGRRHWRPALAVVLTANAHDSTMLEAVVNDIPPTRMPTRRRRRRPAPSTPTRVTTTHAAARSCDAVGSPPASPGAAWSPRSGLAATAGGSSGRSPGCLAGGGCGSATCAVMSASSRSPCWPARRSCSTRSSSQPGDRSECPLTRTGMVQSAGAHWRGG
jgi:hypothetical protein